MKNIGKKIILKKNNNFQVIFKSNMWSSPPQLCKNSNFRGAVVISTLILECPQTLKERPLERHPTFHAVTISLEDAL